MLPDRDRIRKQWMGRGIVILVCLLPAFWLLWEALYGRLGANPVEEISDRTGLWALRLLLATLAVSPIKRITGRASVMRYRRMLGLYAFFYACLHVLTYLLLDRQLLLGEILTDLAKRPYITAGFAAFMLLLPLAVTSTRGMQRRLGRRWKLLHRLVYPASVLAVVHFVWWVKADYFEVSIYGALLSALLVLRALPLRRAVRPS